MTPGIGPFLPRGMISSINVELYMTLLYTKSTIFGSCGFRKEDFDFFMCVSHYEPMADNDAPVQHFYRPQGSGWQDV